AVQSVGEKMSKAGLNTVMGILTVFFVLILISLIIFCFKLIPLILGGSKKPVNKAPEKAPAASAAPVSGSEQTAQNDTELVAVIAAAVAAATGTSTDSFVVRSIKRR
ncbi:MAG: OadG family protein, partial [Lachnospiraceae bacterium]|nr:OadG family protein [Lachnospiraceae bacterium]